ncbi:tetratricopeptide repeat protein [Streptomyces sp. LNU-CPARS28]|uniref:tetratricopeptide repeat protein n=1 Tax=Streptomyces sp. LNU-CPARS28 TaxID=3137371 RepID=UPI003135EE5A
MVEEGTGRARTIRNQARDVYGTLVQVGELHGDLHVHVTPDPTGVVVPLVGLDQATPEFFVGRDREGAELLAVLAPDKAAPEALVVCAGMGGIGKTALARHACDTAVQRGWFTGGALMVDLRGYASDGHVVAAARVFGPLLRGLGVAQEKIPGDPGEQAAVYHQILDTLAREGKPVLLVLDNVSAGAQVRDLLPRQKVHRAVLTTRETLALPGARPFELDVFPVPEALDMLGRALLRADPEDPRVGRDPEAAHHLVDLCGRLPLALEITAALLAEDPDLSFADLADELDRAASKATVLRHGDRAVAAAFDLSWRRLQSRAPTAARLLGLLSLPAGIGLSTDAAAALAGVEPATARPDLRRLRHVHLLSLTDGHWRMHDLVNAYVRERFDAGQLAGPGETADETGLAALRRLLEFYARTAADADTSLTEDGPVGRFRDREGAVAWFERERLSLIGAIEFGGTLSRPRLRYDLADALCPFLARRHYVSDRIAVARHRVDAAARLSTDRRVLAHRHLGWALKAAGRFDEAVAAHRRAVEVSDPGQTGDDALNELGLALRNALRYEEAIEVFRQLVDRGRATGRRRTMAMARSNLASVLSATARHEEALTERQAAVGLWRELDDKAELGAQLNGLGMALLALGRPEGVGLLREAVETSAEAGDRNAESTAQENYCMVLAHTGQPRLAIAEARRSLARFRAVGEPHWISEAHLVLGQTLTRTGKLAAAFRAYQQAIDTSRAAGDRFAEGEYLIVLSDALSSAGRRSEAQAARAKAVEIFRELGDPFRGGLAEGPPHTPSPAESPPTLHSVHGGPGCCLLGLLAVGTGGYFTVREVGWWWLLAGLSALLLLAPAATSALRALQEGPRAWLQQAMTNPIPPEVAQSPARYPAFTSDGAHARAGGMSCLPVLLVTALSWYVGERWRGPEAGAATALAAFTVLTTVRLRLFAHRARTTRRPPRP